MNTFQTEERPRLLDDMNAAESILIPKGEDMAACIAALAITCGIEAPPYERYREERRSLGVTFRYTKGMEIPAWLAAGWADMAVTGSDALIEYPEQTRLRWQPVGEAMCRYSLLVIDGEQDIFEYKLNEARWDGRRSKPLVIPASRPQLLMDGRGDLPVKPQLPVVKSSTELAIKLAGQSAGADIVQSGRSAAKAGLVEWRKLADIYAAFAGRTDNA